MSKIFLSIIGVHLLMVSFFSVTLDRVDATSPTAGPLFSSPTIRNFRRSRLQKMYPVLRNQRLTNNMLSLLQSLRRAKVHKRRQRRMKRKGAFVVSDLEGNPMLVVRKQKIRQQSNYPNQQPTMYDPQKLGLFPFGPVPNFPVPSNMVPFQQVIQPLPYNLENPNPLVQRQAAFPSIVAPQPANVLSQPTNVLPQLDASQTNDLIAPEIKDSPHDEYYDNFDLIPLPEKSPSVLKKDTPIRRFSSFLIESTTLPESSSTAPPTFLSLLAPSISTTTPARQSSELIKQAIDQSSELIKQAIPRDTNNLEQTKGVVNIVSLLAAVLEKAFSVPHEVVLPPVKRESTSWSSVVVPTQTLTSCSAEPIYSVTEEVAPVTAKREDNKTSVGWKDFRLRFAISMIHGKTTPSTTAVNVTTEDIILTSPSPLVEVPSTEMQVAEPIKYTSEDVSAVLQDLVSPLAKLNLLETNLPRYKLEDNTSHCSSMIQKILETVQNIQGQEPDTKVKEDLPVCNITGFWSSLAGGIVLQISNDSNHTVKIHPKTPPSKKGILLESGWEFTFVKPFPKFNLIILNGLNKNCKQVASFVGECRACSGSDSITGNWLLGYPSRSCKEQLASEELVGDVWAREILTEHRRSKLRSIKELGKKASTKPAKVETTTCH